MSCRLCGCATSRRICKQCDIEERAEDRAQARTDGGEMAQPTQGFAAIVAVDVLEDALDAVSVLVDECKLHLEADGLQIRAVDPANVGMVDLSLDSVAFESYTGNGGVIGVNLSRLQDVVGMADSGDLVHLDLDEETRKLHIDVGGISYTLALIDPDSIRQEPDIPELDLTADVCCAARHLQRGAKAADLVSDHIRLTADDDPALHLVAEGDTDDLTIDEDDLLSADVSGPADSLFSLDYLKDMVRAMPSDETVRVELGAEFPVKLHWGFADGAGEVTNMLAPRISSD